MSTVDQEARLTLIGTDREEALEDFARDVHQGLTANPKYLPCRYFYDAHGSALFEAICSLPEYYLTRAEGEILERYADDLATRCPAPVALVELGSGSAVKTRLLIEALLRRQGDLVYAPIDISRSALQDSARLLLADYERLSITGVIGLYEEGLTQLHAALDGPELVLWLGSSVGNFEPDEAAQFLRRLADRMDAADRLLIGMDLDKDPAVLERAYDDAQGVTAAFNLNLLKRINQAFDGDFVLENFTHKARYNAQKRRIEMYLESRKDQHVHLKTLDLRVSFTAGERVHTENSHKYRQQDIADLLTRGGFALEQQYLDAEQRFSLNLARPLR